MTNPFSSAESAISFGHLPASHHTKLTPTSYMLELGFVESVIPGIINSILCAPIYLHDNSYCLNYLHDPRKHPAPEGDYARIIVGPHIILQLTALELAAAGAIHAKKLAHCDMEPWNSIIRLRNI